MMSHNQRKRLQLRNQQLRSLQLRSLSMIPTSLEVTLIWMMLPLLKTGQAAKKEQLSMVRVEVTMMTVIFNFV